MKKLVVLCLTLFLVMGCSRDKSPVLPSSDAELGFYFLADDSTTLYNLGDAPVEKLTLAEKPWLSDDDILTYNFSKHIIFLNKPLKQIFPQFESSGELMRALNVKPFVVVANGEACYVAAFHAAYSSLARMTPYIDLLTTDLNAAHSFAILREWDIQDRQKIDRRTDARVAQALKVLKKYSSD